MLTWVAMTQYVVEDDAARESRFLVVKEVAPRKRLGLCAPGIGKSLTKCNL